MVIGVIGKIGSGKSTCVKYIEEKYGAIVFSCDDIAKELIERDEINYQIKDGSEFFTNENLQEICRIELHPKVFGRINENITNILKESSSKNTKIIVVESALPGPMLFDMCDKVILIESSFEDKVKWLFNGREYGIGKTKLIYDSQKYYEKFYDMADKKIINDGDIDSFKKKIEEVMDEICVTCK